MTCPTEGEIASNESIKNVSFHELMSFRIRLYLWLTILIPIHSTSHPKTVCHKEHDIMLTGTHKMKFCY